MYFETRHVVDFPSQRGNRFGRCHGYGKHELARLARRHRPERSTRGRPRGDAVIDHDCDAAGDVEARAVAKTALPSALDLGELPVARCIEVGLIDADDLNGSSLRTTIGDPPSTIAPIANAGWDGTPIFRTRTRSSGASSRAAISAATGMPLRGNARITGRRSW